MRRFTIAFLILASCVLSSGVASAQYVAHFSQFHVRPYVFVMSDPVILVTDVFSPCTVKSLALNQDLGKAWCQNTGPGNEVFIQWTFVVLEATTGGSEDCDLTLEISKDLSTWTAVASSKIMVGDHANQSNLSGVCGPSAVQMDTIGKICTRVFDEGVVVPVGGGWRIGIDLGETCSALEGIGAWLETVIQ